MREGPAVRPPKEIVVLVVLLLLAMASVLWYVFDRRAHRRVAPPVAAAPAGQVPAAATTPAAPVRPAGTAPAGSAPADAVVEQPVDLTKHDGQTIDFSGGKPVVKQTPEDKAALDAGLKDIADATKDVTFGPPPKPAAPSPAPGKP
jgi:hypothetical protein